MTNAKKIAYVLAALLVGSGIGFFSKLATKQKQATYAVEAVEADEPQSGTGIKIYGTSGGGSATAGTSGSVPYFPTAQPEQHPHPSRPTVLR